MSIPRPRLLGVIRDLNEAGRPFALVGALAVAARATERATKDVDFVVAISSEEEAISMVTFLEGKRDYVLLARMRDPKTALLRGVTLAPRGPEGDTLVVDLLFAICGIESEVVQAAEPIEILPGMRVDVATRAHLIAMKTLSLDDVSRVRDRGDLADLLRTASSADIDKAAKALALMEQRGYGFMVGKDDLQGELSQHCALYAPHLLVGSA